MTELDKKEIEDFAKDLSICISRKIYGYPFDDNLKYEINQYIKVFIHEKYPSLKEEEIDGMYKELCPCCNQEILKPTIYSSRLYKKISPRPFADAIMYSFRFDVYFKDNILQFDIKD